MAKLVIQIESDWLLICSTFVTISPGTIPRLFEFLTSWTIPGSPSFPGECAPYLKNHPELRPNIFYVNQNSG